jgi:hypothetical protein
MQVNSIDNCMKSKHKGKCSWRSERGDRVLHCISGVADDPLHCKATEGNAKMLILLSVFKKICLKN